MQESIPGTNPLVYTLSSTLNIDSVDSIVDEIRNVIVKQNGHLDLVIDASKVEVISTPGVQLMISLGKLLEQQSIKFSINQPSQNLIKTFETLGLEKKLLNWSTNNG